MANGERRQVKEILRGKMPVFRNRKLGAWHRCSRAYSPLILKRNRRNSIRPMASGGMQMPTPGNRSQPASDSKFSSLPERPQIDFEMYFFEEFLARAPALAEAL